MNRLQDFLDNPRMMTGTATVVVDERLTLLTANSAFYSLTGEVSGIQNHADALLPLLAPEERSPLLARLAQRPPSLEWEGQLDRPNGENIRIHLSATRMEGVLYKNRFPIYFVVFSDTTADIFRSAEYEHLKYALIADISEDFPFEYDFQTDTLVYTPKYREVFGQEPIIHGFREELSKGTLCDPVSQGFRNTFLALGSDSPSEPLQNTPEQFLPTNSGKAHWFALYSTTLHDTQGKPLKSVGVLRDIDRHKREQLRLLDKSRTDAMTGLCNKATTEEEIRLALREVRPGSLGVLFMIDVDNFKLINDNMGHLAGDSIIMSISRQLERLFRQDDIIGRVGGDEFHVYMRHVSDPASINERARQLCSSISTLFISSNLDSTVSVSVGIGVTDSPISYEDLFRKADVALYRAKDNGKNRYEIFGQSTEVAGENLSLPPSLAVNPVRNSIMVDIIDTLFSVSNLHEGINKALEFIGNALRVDKLLIFEYSFDGKHISITHEWCSDPKWATSEAYKGEIPVSRLKLATAQDSNGIYYCSDFSAVPPEEKTFLLDPSISSLLQCDILRDENVVGHICFEERGCHRFWTQQEVDTLIIMSKLIGESIRQRQSDSLLRHSFNDTRNILDSLPSTAVYVIDSDRHIVYFNDTVSRAYPNICNGVQCHDLFWGRKEPCSFCPVTSHGDLPSYTTLLEHSPIQGLAEISISKIFWSNKPAHVVLISEHLKSPEEYAAKAKRDSLARALCSSYHYVVDINLDTGSCAPIAGRLSVEKLPDSGNYTQYFEMFIENVVPSFRAKLRNGFSPENLRKAFATADENKEIHFEYQYQYPEGPKWRARTAFAYTQDDKSRHVLLCVRDIEARKHVEEARRQEEENVRIALQNSYAKIYRMDLSANTFICLFHNAKLIAPVDVTGRFDEDIQRVKKRVHIEDRASFLSFFTVEHILKGLDTETELSTEYRKLGLDGNYHWMLALIVKMPSGKRGEAMLLVRDVTDLRDEEATFYKVLQSSYSEIYEITLDNNSVQVLQRDDQDRINMPRLSFRYWEDTQAIAEHSVHPDDRETFLEHYAPENIRRGLATTRRLLAEYRLRAADGGYHWLSSILLPLPGPSGRMLILCQDIDKRKKAEETAARLVRRQSAVFRQSGDCIIEVNLQTWQYVRDISTPLLPDFQRTGDYHDFFSTILTYIHPEDREKAREITSPEFLLKACKKHSRTITAQYRLRNKGVELWLENRVFFLEDDGDMTAFFLVRDVSEQKRLERERALEEERFNIALRNTYTEIYEINISTKIPHLVYANQTPMIPVDDNKDATLDTAAQTLIHPEDRERFLSCFAEKAVPHLFNAGYHARPSEYRRLGRDGKWYWVAASIVPLCAHDACRSDVAMLLVRDITDQRAAEQQRRISEQYDHALRNIYDELYELNITRNSYRIVYHLQGKYVTPPEHGDLGGGVKLVSNDMIHPEDKARFLEFFDLAAVRRHFATDREYRIGEFRKLWQDGQYHWASLTMFPVSQDAGGDEIYLVFIMDIGEKKQAEELAQQNIILERQRLADERYRTIVEQTATLVFEWNIENGVRYISAEIAARFWGTYDKRDLMHIWRDDGVIHPDDAPLLKTFLEETHDKPYTEMTARFRKRSGDYIWCKVALTCLRDEHGMPKRYIGTINDVDKATRSVLALKYRAEFDLLTDIYNRHTFYLQTEQILHAHPERRYSIIRMDIDRFKVINDLYGLKEGDKLLIFIATQLRKHVGKSGIYGRLEGDIFCVCTALSQKGILDLITQLSAELTEYPLAYKIIPSFGICEVDNIDTPINVLCDWANLALKTIKGNYLKSYAYYDGKLREKILEEKTIENQMHDALLQGQFVLYLQPKVHIPTSRIIGSEGLVRWVHPTEGLMPPDRFIPLFEKNGFILRLDEYIWEQACITLRRWMDHGLPPTPISVNMSRMHIHDPRLREKLLALISRYQIPPRLLELEITESAFLDDEDGLFKAMQQLQADGFQFFMDDFGSGYSSLNMLKNIPVDFIKIDRKFLNEVVATERGKTVIRFSISLAKEMNIKVIAEGVETEQQAAFLLQAGCAYAQGYFYSRPLTVPAFEDLAFHGNTPFPIAPSIQALAETLTAKD